MATVGRGRRPKPAALRIVDSDRNEPRGLTVPIPPDMPQAPAFLHAYAVEEWDRQAPTLYSLGVLTEPDQMALAAWCQCVARWRDAEERLKEYARKEAEAAARGEGENTGGLVETTDKGNRIQSVLLNVANAAMRDMLRFAAEFGMTPSARARIEGKGNAEKTDPIRKKYFKR